jgi:nucleoid-associated protein YgaU
MWTCGTDVRWAVRLALAAVVAGACVLPSSAASSRGKRPKLIEHKIKRGHTLAELAEDYYDDRDRYESLARINDIDPPFRLKTGRILRVPISGIYTVRSGDTPSRIAEKLFGGASRYALLMEMNGLTPESPLSVRQELEIPAVLEHRLGKGEMLGGLAKRYYGDASRAGWIARYNGISRPDRVKRGTRLEIPLIGFVRGRSPAPLKRAPTEPKRAARAQASGKTKPPAKTPAPRKTPEPAAKKPPQERPPDPALQRAIDLYHQGDYRQAASVLDSLLEKGSLRSDEKSLALRYRAYCAVATGDSRTAGRTFRALHDIAPSWKPNPLEDSPKIRSAFAAAISSPGS